MVGAFINAFAVNIGMYLAGRVIIGFGGGMAKVLAPALLQEIAHPRLRPILSGMFYSFSHAGSIVSSWFVFGTLRMGDTPYAWRVPSLFQIAGPILVVGLTWTAPESPRWLVKCGNEEKALAVLAKHHANADSDDPLALYEFEEIRRTLELERDTKKVSYLDFFKSRPNLHRLAVLVGVSSTLVGARAHG